MASFDDIEGNWPDGPDYTDGDCVKYAARLAGLTDTSRVRTDCGSHHFGEWMDACRQAYRERNAAQAQEWLDAGPGTRKHAIVNKWPELAPIFRAHLWALLHALGKKSLADAAAKAGQPEGMIGDLADACRERALESIASERLIVVLASSTAEPAHLHAEMRPDGSGSAYPAPCQAFVPRDEKFQAAEQAAAGLLLGAGHGACDLRWRVDLVSRQPVTALENNSFGLAFALAAASLDFQVHGAPAALGLRNYIDWGRIAASAGFDGAKATAVCANNMAAKIEAAAGAGATLFLAAPNQGGIPPDPPVPVEPTGDIAATSDRIVSLQSATALAWSLRWENAGLYLLLADTGLPSLLALLSFVVWFLTAGDWFLTVMPAALPFVLLWYFRRLKPVTADSRHVLDATARRRTADWEPMFRRTASLLAANPGAAQAGSICYWYAGILTAVPDAGRLTLPETRLHVVRAHFTRDLLRNGVAIVWWLFLIALAVVLMLPTRTMLAEAMPPWVSPSIEGGGITALGSGRFAGFAASKLPPFAQFSAPAGMSGVIAVVADDRNHAERLVRFHCDQCSISRDNKVWDHVQEVPLRNSSAEIHYFIAGNAQPHLRVELVTHTGHVLDTAQVTLRRE